MVAMYQVFNSHLWLIATILNCKRSISVIIKSGLMSDKKFLKVPFQYCIE